MDLEDRVLISYARIDNETPSPEQPGWIDMLHRALEVRVTQLLGKKTKIWRDSKLRGHEPLEPKIFDQVRKAAVLVSVLSPGYLNSDWCRKERTEFLKTAEQEGSLYVNNKARLFKVIKTYVPLEEHLPEMLDFLGYEFFTVDPLTGRRSECNWIFGPYARRECLEKLEDLAIDISDLLEELTGQSPPSSGATIYLAETSSDLRHQRDEIRRELRARGHTILPDRKLPRTGPEVESYVRDCLARCTMSIHLLGAHYGFIPEAEAAGRSVIQLQNDLAAEYSRDKDDFVRLIWLPIDPDLQAVDDNQKKLVDNLWHDPQGAELLKDSLGKLKTVIKDKLIAPEQTSYDNQPSGEEPTRIYLICDRRDLDNIIPLEDYLYGQKYELIKPLFDEDETEVSKDHQESLRICDAALIYYGRANEAWLRGKLRDLRKAPGYGRARPMQSKAIYVAGPKDPQKERYRTREVDEVITNFGDFSPDKLTKFLSKIEGRQRAYA